MNVEEALNTATSLENKYGIDYGRQDDGMDNFGHPETPRMALHGLSHNDANKENTNLLVVSTKHCIVAQIVSSSNDENGGTKGGPVSQAIHLGSLFPVEQDDDNPVSELADSDEIISCLQILELENPSAVCPNSIPEPAKGSSRFIAAVVVGTNRSRVLTTEVVVRYEETTQTWSIENSSGRHDMSLPEVLPVDSTTVADSIRRKNKERKNPEKSEAMVPFQPSGGVSSMYSRHNMTVNSMEQETTYIWITYADGTIVRMHHAAVFPYVWAEGADSDLSVDDLLLRFKHTAFLRFHTRLPPGEESNVTIVPLPKYFPSPFAPVNSEELSKQHEALVFGKTDSMPTLCVYSSEDQFWEPQITKKSDNLMVDVVLGGTKALVGGVVGALRWATKSEQSSGGAPGNADEPEVLPSTPFPSIWRQPMYLHAGAEFHDLPRIIEHCSIDPDGQHASFCDGLGRVLLMDLTTKQIIRMWKGLRQASCTWIRESSPVEEHAKTKPNRCLLVIHSKQRRVVEVWPSRSGGRLASYQVHRSSVVVPNYHPHREYGAFVLDSIDQGGPPTALKRVDMKSTQQQPSSTQSPSLNQSSSSREATMRVQHLKQILSVGKAMSHTQTEVFEAFCAIKSLKDLSSCLDLIASTTVLEDELGVDGTSFQKRALQYCGRILSENGTNSDTSQSTTASNLARKVEFYERVIKAYDIMREYESSSLNEGSTTSKPLSNFAQESLGWAEVYQHVTRMEADPAQRVDRGGPLKFYKFASSCVFPVQNQSTNKAITIYLSESTRTRHEILHHLFRPLLGWFSSGVVGSVFSVLGIREDFHYVLRCFGEWFMTLELPQIRDRCLKLPDSPMSRFLRDTIEREFMSGTNSPAAIDSLSDLCEDSTDLIRAFSLATLSREVQLHISRQKEDTTFATADISKWCELVKQLDKSRERVESLLRKLRVCLLVSLRLYGEDLAPFPLSVKNLETETDFSVYKWVALDELSLSQNHAEIVSTEVACGLSKYSLDPLSGEADEPEKFSVLQRSCLDRKMQLTDADKNGSLLLFLASFNEPRLLAAHRSLLLSFKWIKEPKYLQILRHAISSLESLPPSSMAYGVRLEVWNGVIAPVYRAQLFGFSDVHELKEEDFGPLFESQEFKSEFGRMALQILTMLGDTPYTENVDENEVEVSPDREGSRTWPPVEKDHAINVLLRKSRRIEATAIDVHVASVCALLFSKDTAVLNDCLPELVECFHPSSLFDAAKEQKVRTIEQEQFLNDAVVSLAKELHDGPIESFGVLSELSLLSTRWGFDQKWLNTNFLTVAYELGRDKDVDELMTTAAPHVLPQQFIVAGVNIVCKRLDYFFIVAKSRGDLLNVLGLLDAELCEWIHQRADGAQSFVKNWFEFANAETSISVLLSNSQILTYRLLSLAAIANEEASMRARIHSLSVLAGTLVKALEA